MYSVKNVFLLVVLVATAIAPVYAAPEDQTIVKDYNASPGWTSIVPMSIDPGSHGTDLISYNAETGHTIMSVGGCIFGPR